MRLRPVWSPEQVSGFGFNCGFSSAVAVQAPSLCDSVITIGDRVLDSDEEENNQRERKVSRKKQKAEGGQSKTDVHFRGSGSRNCASFSIGVSEKLSEDKV